MDIIAPQASSVLVYYLVLVIPDFRYFPFIGHRFTLQIPYNALRHTCIFISFNLIDGV